MPNITAVPDCTVGLHPDDTDNNNSVFDIEQQQIAFGDTAFSANAGGPPVGEDRAMLNAYEDNETQNVESLRAVRSNAVEAASPSARNTPGLVNEDASAPAALYIGSQDYSGTSHTQPASPDMPAADSTPQQATDIGAQMSANSLEIAHLQLDLSHYAYCRLLTEVALSRRRFLDVAEQFYATVRLDPGQADAARLIAVQALQDRDDALIALVTARTTANLEALNALYEEAVARSTPTSAATEDHAQEDGEEELDADVDDVDEAYAHGLDSGIGDYVSVFESNGGN
ncbi:unnamed protein product [Peniophora sp. CBMAI 1063]|nr:unnamed protein product [Peniophora sp. CBMAI 1063]